MDLFRQLLSDTGQGLKGYFRAQMKLMMLTFVILLSGFLIIDIKYSVLIAFIISLIDIIPVLGSGMIMIPWAIINLIVDNGLAGPIAILYVVLVIARQILEPKIVGKEIGVKPLYTFLATVLGGMFLGPLGVILGPLIAVVLNSIMKSKKIFDDRNHR